MDTGKNIAVTGATGFLGGHLCERLINEGYKVSILADCCTSVDQMIHNIALNAVSTRIPFLSNEAL